MLREIPIIDVNGKRRKLGLYPKSIIFIEELTNNKCNIVVRIQGKEIIYLSPKPFKYLQNFVNFSDLGLFMEN
jgi:hypothetical protein